MQKNTNALQIVQNTNAPQKEFTHTVYMLNDEGEWEEHVKSFSKLHKAKALQRKLIKEGIWEDVKIETTFTIVQ
jgi:hypothetical protein